MKTQYKNYIFLLSIIVLALFGGFFVQSYNEAFSVKETYNYGNRQLHNQILGPLQERIWKHSHFFNIFGRNTFF